MFENGTALFSIVMGVAAFWHFISKDKGGSSGNSTRMCGLCNGYGKSGGCPACGKHSW